MTKSLRIKDFARHEHADARKGTRMPWVKTPTSHDGLGFLTLMDHQDGMAHFGAWNLILQVAANCPTRGLLVTDGGRPLGGKELALKTRGSAKVFEEAIKRLLEIGWLEVVDAGVTGDHLSRGQAERGEQVEDVKPCNEQPSGKCRESVGKVSGDSRDKRRARGETRDESESERARVPDPEDLTCPAAESTPQQPAHVSLAPWVRTGTKDHERTAELRAELDQLCRTHGRQRVQQVAERLLLQDSEKRKPYPEAIQAAILSETERQPAAQPLPEIPAGFSA